MALIEVLRVQRMLTWYGGILTLVTLAILAFGSHTSVDVNGTVQTFSGVTVPFAAVVPLAMFFAATFASWAGTAFNRESVTRDISWTKPLPRPLFALQIVAVDLVAIASIYVLALLAIALILWRLQFTVVADPTLGTVLTLGLGVSFMWYALINLLTCMLPPSARMIGGIIWPIALLLLALAQLGGAFGAVVRAIDVINPLAYMNGVSSSANGIVQDAVTTLPLDLRPAAVYAFAALFCALAILIWPRKEA